jgi:hypothetical protein
MNSSPKFGAMLASNHRAVRRWPILTGNFSMTDHSFPPLKAQPGMSGALDFARIADEAAARARTADERASFKRIATLARMGDVSASSSYSRAAKAFAEADAASAVRSAEIQGVLDRGVEAVNVLPSAPINSNFDLIRNRLPERVQRPLDAMEAALDDVRAVRRSLIDDQQDLIKDRAEIISKIRMNTEKDAASMFGVPFLMSEENPSLIKMRGDQARIEKRLAKIVEKLDASRPRFEALDRLQKRCQDYLRFLLNHSVALAFHDGKPGKKVTGDVKQQIADVRQEIAELAADLREIQARPHPSAEIKAKIPAFVRSRATPPNVMGAVDHGENIQWPTAGVRGRSTDPKMMGSIYDMPPELASSVGSTDDTLGILCWSDPERMINRIEEQIDLYADDANAIDDLSRANGVKDLFAKILSAERHEETLIREAEEKEIPIFRRGDADPRVVLALSDSLPAAKEF